MPLIQHIFLDILIILKFDRLCYTLSTKCRARNGAASACCCGMRLGIRCLRARWAHLRHCSALTGVSYTASALPCRYIALCVDTRSGMPMCACIHALFEQMRACTLNEHVWTTG